MCKTLYTKIFCERANFLNTRYCFCILLSLCLGEGCGRELVHSGHLTEMLKLLGILVTFVVSSLVAVSCDPLLPVQLQEEEPEEQETSSQTGPKFNVPIALR